jgi:hypothetical protein
VKGQSTLSSQGILEDTLFYGGCPDQTGDFTKPLWSMWTTSCRLIASREKNTSDFPYTSLFQNPARFHQDHSPILPLLLELGASNLPFLKLSHSGCTQQTGGSLRNHFWSNVTLLGRLIAFRRKHLTVSTCITFRSSASFHLGYSPILSTLSHLGGLN